MGERDIFHITVLSTSIYFIEYYIYKVAVKRGVIIDISPIIKVIKVLFC